MMADSLREQLSQFTVEELEDFLRRGVVPIDRQEDRQVYLAVLIEVIKEKKAQVPFYPVF